MLRAIAASLLSAWIMLCVVPHALAAEPGSAACKAELQATHKKMRESVNVLDSTRSAPAAARCAALSAARELAEDIRESTARCEPPEQRKNAVRDADDVIDAIDTTYQKTCPARPGLVRVRATWVEHITREKLPKALAVLHRCVTDDESMFFTDQRFDLGRLIVLGCPRIADPSPYEVNARNAAPDMLKLEQAHVYVARDKEGDDARAVVFPIFTADGRESTTDLVPAERVFIGETRDLISMYWTPGKPGVCRAHAVWRVSDAKANLVLWQEAADCSAGAKTTFTTVLDRR
ncbi:MAG TPA: hypothetical protein VFA57_20245 [Pseudolabrys sp.]|nr:hypothetical protein [Pseudolabrys sp.]